MLTCRQLERHQTLASPPGHSRAKHTAVVPCPIRIDIIGLIHLSNLRSYPRYNLASRKSGRKRYHRSTSHFGLYILFCFTFYYWKRTVCKYSNSRHKAFSFEQKLDTFINPGVNKFSSFSIRWWCSYNVPKTYISRLKS